MKVVLFCGGQGMRLRDYSEAVPKPLVPIGQRPILWHLMKYYAHYGHREFVLCLGYGAEAIKNYFIDYDERLTNDFVLRDGGRRVELLGSDIQDWSITFVYTGLAASIGERFLAIREHVEDEEIFLANYADGLTDLPLDEYVASFAESGAVACLVTVPVPHSFHVVESDAEGRVKSLRHVRDTDMRVNGGFFAFRRQIFDYMEPGEELVEEPFRRLADRGLLRAHSYSGFWRSMDTFKDRKLFQALVRDGDTPWRVWEREGPPR